MCPPVLLWLHHLLSTWISKIRNKPFIFLHTQDPGGKILLKSENFPTAGKIESGLPTGTIGQNTLQTAGPLQSTARQLQVHRSELLYPWWF